MTKLTSKKALEYVLRIEALNEQMEDVYAEVRGFDGEYNDNVIRDAVKARADQRERADDAGALIGSFDWDEDGNRIAPPSAWDVVSARIRAMIEAQPPAESKRLLVLVDHIDKLQALAIEKGLPVVGADEVEAEMQRLGMQAYA